MDKKYIIGDNLKVLNSLITTFDFCYIDPPYNTGRDFGDFGGLGGFRKWFWWFWWIWGGGFGDFGGSGRLNRKS